MVNYGGLYNKDFFGDRLNQSYLSNRKLHFRIIGDGTILPCLFNEHNIPLGGIIDSNGRFLRGTFFNNAGGAYLPQQIFYSNQTVVYLGTLSVSWGHCITDSLRWSWFLNSDMYRQYFRDCPIVYSIAGGGGASPDVRYAVRNFRRGYAAMLPRRQAD